MAEVRQAVVVCIPSRHVNANGVCCCVLGLPQVDLFPLFSTIGPVTSVRVNRDQVGGWPLAVGC